MSVISLTFTSSDREIVSGIPESVSISSSVPANIYYTLGGTTPTESSNIYTNSIDMPDGVNSVVLSAFAVDYDGNESAVLTQTYAPDVSNITITRNIGAEGKKVNSYSDDTDIITGYDYEGNPVRYIDEELYKLDPIYSDRGWNGKALGTAINVEFADPEDTAYPYDDQTTTFSTNEKAYMFDPYAKVIEIDARKDNEVKITNRPFGSMRHLSREVPGLSRVAANFSTKDSTYVSGGFVRSFYDRDKMVSYYFDHNTCRHVKSIQSSPQIPRTMGSMSFVGGHPLVFKWIYGGKHSIIPI